MKLKHGLLMILCSALFSTHVLGKNEWKVKIQMKLPAKATVLAYSSDASRVAVGHSNGDVSVWNVNTGELLKLVATHTKEINSIQFISEDCQLFTIGDDDRAVFLSTSDWTVKNTIEGVAFAGGISPDEKLMVAMDPKQAIWIWDLKTAKPIKQLTDPGKGGAQTLAFTNNGESVVVNIRPYLINIETRETFSFTSRSDKKTAVNIESLGGNQASISLGALQDDDAIVHRVVTSRTGNFVALGRGWYGQPAFVDVWDLRDKKRLGRFKAKGGGTLSSFSFDSSLLAIEGAEKVTFWRLEGGKQSGSVKGNGIMQFSPKSMEIAVTNDNDLLIYTSEE